MTNRNTETRIPFGYISSNILDQDVVYELLYGSEAVDETYKEALAEHMKEALAQHQYDADGTDFVYDGEDFEFDCDESIISGTYQGVSYQSSWLGGALNFFIFESPHITDKARRASLCVPGAGILDTLDGSETSYDVPSEWRPEDR